MEQTRTRDGPVAEAPPDRVGGVHHAPLLLVHDFEHAGLLGLAQPGRGHAEQPYPLASNLRSDQLQRRPPDRVRQVARLRQRFLPRDRSELGVSNLHGHGAGADSRRPKSGRHAFGQRQQRPFDFGRVYNVDGERRLMTDGLGRLPAADHRVRVNPQRPIVQRSAMVPERSSERLHRQRRQLADRSNAEPVQSIGRPGPDPPQPPDLQRGQEGGLFPGRHHDQAVGLAEVAPHFGDELVRRDADRNGQSGRCDDLSLDAAGDLGCGPEKPLRTGDVQERLVDRDLLDGRREAPQHGHNFAADALVLGAVDRHEYAVRAE